MKTILHNGSYYQYPDGIGTLVEFIMYINQNKGEYIPLIRYEIENCVYPYFISEDTKKVYINFGAGEIEEAEIKVLPNSEYEKRLLKCIEEVCKDCANYIEGEDIKSHRGKLSLDGECYFKQKI